jgi:protease-4
VVAKGRTGKLVGTLKDIADGKVYTADQALKLGLVDQIDYPEAAYAVAITRAALPSGVKPEVVRLKEPPGLLDLLGAQSGVGGAGAASRVEFNGIKVDANSFYSLLVPKVMYLWDGR